MKKIIIAANTMDIGGTEKALLGMLKSIDYSKYDITLLLKKVEGELLDEIPENVNVKRYTEYDHNIKELLKRGKIFTVIKYIYYSILIKLSNNTYRKYVYLNKMLPKNKEKYDIAISYYMPMSTQVVYVINNINAKHKYAWMHCDVTKMGKEMKKFEDIYNKYDKVVCVSKELQNKCREYFSSLNNKVALFYNVLDKETINKKADDYKAFKDNYEGIRICTVGRLSPEKQQDYIIPIIMKLKKKGLKVKWYCVGEGVLRDKLEKSISEKELKSEVVLVGSKNNPYPYIKESDIYVQLSRHEGYCLTLAEARFLNKPIITTDFVGAREQIKNGKTGIIVEDNIDLLHKEIEKLIVNPEKRQQLVRNLMNLQEPDIN